MIKQGYAKGAAGSLTGPMHLTKEPLYAMQRFLTVSLAFLLGLVSGVLLTAAFFEKVFGVGVFGFEISRNETFVAADNEQLGKGD